jgi:hypothetical protein
LELRKVRADEEATEEDNKEMEEDVHFVKVGDDYENLDLARKVKFRSREGRRIAMIMPLDPGYANTVVKGKDAENLESYLKFIATDVEQHARLEKDIEKELA